MHDLVLRGGRVLDPGAGIDERADLGVRDGRVAAIGAGLEGAEVVDAAGLLVVPGLVDLHTHVLAGFSFWGVDPDEHAWTAGATTWVDAGSAGGYAIDGLAAVIAGRAAVRVLAFLNLSSIGLVAPTGELCDELHADEDLCAEMAERHPGFVVGIKARIDRFTVGDRGLEPLHAALRVADRTGLPLMVHIGHGPPDVDGLLDALRPGDVLTHCATPATMSLVDERGAVRPAARRAAERGVVLDLGHGAGAFSFAVAERLLADGLAPTVVSSDAHQLSVRGAMVDLPTCMTKLLHLGMALEDVVAAATTRPAAVIRRDDLGTLRPGAPADIALLALDDEPVELVDVLGARRTADRRLRAVATFVAGQKLAVRPAPVPAPWAAAWTQSSAASGASP